MLFDEIPLTALVIPQQQVKIFIFLLVFLYYGKICVLSLQSASRKEVSTMEYIITVFLAVMAQVIGHYVCKWLDRQHHDN